jgi:hypothetical protein
MGKNKPGPVGQFHSSLGLDNRYVMETRGEIDVMCQGNRQHEPQQLIKIRKGSTARKVWWMVDIDKPHQPPKW